MLSKDCEDLYFLTLSYMRASGNYEELWTEQEAGICYDDVIDWYVFSGDWNESNMQSYTKEIKSCYDDDEFVWVEDNTIKINMSQKNFTEVVLPELEQEGNLIDVYLMLAYKDTQGNIINGMENVFVLSITADTTVVNECAGATATKKAKSDAEYSMSFGEYVEDETDKAYDHVTVWDALTFELDTTH
jgi:hypothetical protein